MMSKNWKKVLARRMLAANGFYWLAVWVLFFVSSHHASPAWPPIEDSVAVAGRASSLLASSHPNKGFVFLLFWPNAPSWVLVWPLFKSVLDFQRFGMNLSGVRMVCVCLISFLQWYGIAKGVVSVARWRSRNDHPKDAVRPDLEADISGAPGSHS
jgi:hypothetical protein